MPLRVLLCWKDSVGDGLVDGEGDGQITGPLRNGAFEVLA